MLLQNLQAEFAEAISSNDRTNELVEPAINLLIYKNNIETALISSLESTYPLIVKLLAKNYFNHIAKEYIYRYPSSSGNLHDYGEYFSDFLACYSPLSDFHYLPEVALFEWTCHRLCFSAECSAFDIKMLEAISTEQYPNLHFALNSTCALHKFQYPILRIIDLCKGEIDEIVDVNSENVNLLIQRRNLEIVLTPLSEGAFLFLTSIREDQSLSNALETALIAEPSFNLEEKLLIWIKNKVIVDCYF